MYLIYASSVSLADSYNAYDCHNLSILYTEIQCKNVGKMHIFFGITATFPPLLREGTAVKIFRMNGPSPRREMAVIMVGVSTACFYPEETERALHTVGELGFSCTEIFINTFSELEKDFCKNLKRIADSYGIRISSVHPFTPAFETVMLFSNYERRFYDSLEFYKKYCEAASEIGARYIVIHGSRQPGVISQEEYFTRFAQLYEMGRAWGVHFAQENVVGYRAGLPDFLCAMRDFMGSDFKMVFDIKQAVREKIDPMEYVERLGPSMVHVHINDHMSENTCMVPGEGSFDFCRFFQKLQQMHYDGDYIMEVYRDNFKTQQELLQGKMYLESILSNGN